MNILTDEEKKALYDRSDLQPYYWLDGKDFADMIESAVLSKLAEQAGEPVACAIFAENGNIRIWSSVSEPVRKLAEAEGLNLVRLYTESQLAAAQQRTAEACAKVCESNHDKACYDQGNYPDGYDLGKAIRNGEWREYL